MPGPFEIVAILLIVLLLFGAKRLPEIGRSIGKAFREFKRSVKGINDEQDDDGSNDKTSKKDVG